MIHCVNRATIQEFTASCKGALEGLLEEWGTLLIVLLVAGISFGLGRISALEGARSPVSIGEAPQSASVAPIALGGQFVAARGGSVYYYPWCTGAQKIGQGNRVWFTSETAAQKAGYRAAKNCKGLATD